MLRLLFIAATISLFFFLLLFYVFLETLCWYIYAILSAVEFSSCFFLNTYDLLLIECKHLCIIINLFGFWFSLFFVHFKNDWEYLINETALVFYYFMQILHAYFNCYFNWRWSERKSLQISKTFLNILAGLNSSIVWMISILQFLPTLFYNFEGHFKGTN